MSTPQHATFLRIWDPETGTTQFAVQNYYQQATITSGGDDYQYLPFTIEGLASTGSADTSEVVVTLPALTLAVAAVEEGIAGQHLARLTVYAFASTTGPDSPPGGQTTLLELAGEVIGGGSDNDASVSMRIGSALSPIGAQVPPRKFTTALVGVPCRL